MSDIPTDFPYESRFVEVEGSKMHYVEVGSGDPILFLHGQPTSSYLWRNVLPHLAPLGRAIAPDLIGFGRSDKPDIEYRFVDHARYIDGFIEALGLDRLTFVIHDWGSGLGFHWARRHPERVRGLAFFEAILAPIPSWDDFPAELRDVFRGFRSPETGRSLLIDQNVFIEKVLPGAVVRGLTEVEMDRYREPFKDPASREPVYRWPNELPIGGEPADVTEIVGAYNAWLQETDVPKLLLHAEPGAITRAPLVEWCKANLKELEVVHVGAGIHYLQEDNPDGIGKAVADWYRRKVG
jgi:haloalkane dehalogenase